jgi:hypothetical protein
MGVAEWLSEHWGGTGWVFAILAGCGVLVAGMLVVPWAAFRTWKDPERWIGIRRHGRKWAVRRERAEGRHRAPEGGQSTWEYIDSGAWAVVSTGRAESRQITEDTYVLNDYALPRGRPGTAEEGEHESRRRALGTTAA